MDTKINITELQREFNFIRIYPKIEHDVDKQCYITNKMDSKTIQSMQKKLKKQTNHIETYEQNEYYFNNLVKVEKTYSNRVLTGYFAKKNSNCINDNMFVVCEQNEMIDSDSFPNLTEYDKIVNKKIEKYKINSVYFVFVTQNNETTYFIDVSNMQDERSLTSSLRISSELEMTDK